MSRAVTTMEKVLIVLVLIAIVVPPVVLYSTGLTGVPADVGELRDALADVAAAERELAEVVGDLGEAVGEYAEEIAAIEEMIAALEATLRRATRLTWWAPITEVPRREAYLSAMEDYSKENPEIMIEFHHVDDLPEKLKLAVPAGVGPDFIRWAHDKIGELKLLDLIVPIEDYISPEFKEQIPDYVWEAVTLDGHIWGIPETAESVALLYNKDMVSTPPATMDEMIAIMANHHDPAAGKYGISYPANIYSIAAFIQAFGGYYYDDATDTVGLNDSRTIQGVEYLFDNVKPYMLQDLDYGAQTALFTEGKAPLAINGPWYFSVPTEAGLNWGLAKLPTIPGVGPLKPFMGVQAFMVTENCKDIEATVKFLEWITSPPVAVDLSVVTGNLPVHLGALEDDRIKNDPIKSALAEQLEDAIPMSKKPEMGPVWGRGYNALDAMWTGTKTIEDALNEAQALVLEDIEKMHE